MPHVRRSVPEPNGRTKPSELSNSVLIRTPYWHEHSDAPSKPSFGLCRNTANPWTPNPMTSHPKPHEPHLQAVRAGEPYQGKQGLMYAPAISAETVGSQAIHMQLLTIPPGGRAKAHKHASHETSIYMLSGVSGMWYGDQLEQHVLLGPTEFLYIPADMPHLPYNPSATENAIADHRPHRPQRTGKRSPPTPSRRPAPGITFPLWARPVTSPETSLSIPLTSVIPPADTLQHKNRSNRHLCLRLLRKR